MREPVIGARVLAVRSARTIGDARREFRGKKRVLGGRRRRGHGQIDAASGVA